MKKIIYLTAFTVLGALVGFLVHGIIEIWYINLLLTNFERFSLGFSFPEWFAIHKYFAFITFLGGALLGFWQGRHWWQVIYVEKRYGNC